MSSLNSEMIISENNIKALILYKNLNIIHVRKTDKDVIPLIVSLVQQNKYIFAMEWTYTYFTKYANRATNI